MTRFAIAIAYLLLCSCLGLSQGVFWFGWASFCVALFAMPLWLMGLGQDTDNLQDLPRR